MEYRKKDLQDGTLVVFTSSDEDELERKTRRKRINEQQNPTTYVEDHRTSLTNGFDTHQQPETKKIEHIPYGKQEISNLDITEQLKRLNLPLSSSKSNSTEKNNAPIPTTYFNKELGHECLLHKPTSRDTVQGLSLKYGVEVADIKRINKIWGNNDLFARKEIIIPTTMDAYLAFSAKQSTSGTRSTPPPKGLDKRDETIKKFMEIAQCDKDIARHYLEEKKWNFAKALGFYYSETEKKVSAKPNGSQVPIVPLDDLEIWTDDDRAKQLQKFEEMTVHAISGPANLRVVKKSVQDRLEHDSEDMFNL